MNKEQFLLTLQNALSGMPRADLERTLQYYREMIEDRIEEGMTEQQAVADVGDPIELAEAIRNKPVKQTAIRESRAPKPPKAPKAPKAPKERKPMSGGTKALLVVIALILAAAGIALVIGSLNIRKDSGMKEYTFANTDIHALMIESGAAEVKLCRATDGICRVQCVESPTLKYDVVLSDGTLNIQRESKWSLFSFSLKEDYLRIYLPQSRYESLWIKASSGGVSVSEDLCFTSAIVKVSSGGIGFAADVSSELNLQASSGGISISGSSPKTLFASASSGGLSLSDMNPRSVSLHATSGGIRLSEVRCSELSADCSSGAIRLSDVIAEGKMTLGCTSGAIKLDDCDAGELYIECTSGSVSGHLLTPKVWSASSTSGSVRVPASGSGGTCYVKTTSGSIRFD